ncbi:hypothetical protein BJX63DRAFT_436806 [Aspergillus granulosus]|uniref:F-box domain-containing protein n=1 Tax=Aspergillus granulosus TaxID=176169 RepID=A0ABR4GYP5_9EURO
MASITLLPAEILDKICYLIDKKDLYSLRLACKSLATRTYHHLAPAFSEIYLAVTSDGLQFLKDIAGHEILRDYVTAVWIMPSLFDAYYDWNIDQFCRVLYENESPPQPRKGSSRAQASAECVDIGDERIEAFLKRPKAIPQKIPGRPTPADGELYRIYQGIVFDHLQILFDSPEGHPGTATLDGNHFRTRTLLHDTLETWLPWFPRLRSLGIRRYVGHKPPPVNVRGIQRLRSQLGFNPVEPRPYQNWKSSLGRRLSVDVFDMSVFAALIAAITEASMQIKVEVLDTGSLMADTDDQQLLFLSLQPILIHLRHLFVIITSSHVEST